MQGDRCSGRTIRLPEQLAREEVPGGGGFHLVWLSYQFGFRAYDPRCGFMNSSWVAAVDAHGS